MIEGILFLIFVWSFAIVSADYECLYSDGRTLYCESCCEYSCCETTGETSSVYIACGITGSVIFVAFLIGCCIRRRRAIVRGQAQQPNRVVVVNRTICTARSAPGVAPVYNSSVPQTGTYSYVQPAVLTMAPPPYTPSKDGGKAEPPPPYSA
ncbi:hypothetical protein CHS0354_027839 [Potamilus streckersoni]|uniref:Uncharacterized protein n=1 Tax=Potamilus streckersoni TaxID=2493646 RepID=A0AAE0W5W9_9BIVA|nr:hypothetical protein CHS0354_027839 [Potamilus streckersoni]